LFYTAAWSVCLLSLKMLFGFRVHGRRNVPRTGGVILAVNHASYLDPVVVGCGLTRPVHFMARATLFQGLLGVLIRRLNAFPVERGGADRRAVKEFLARVDAGRAVMLFPEGTRTRDGVLQGFMPGVGALAVRAAAPVVPTYVAGTFAAWPRHRSLPRPAPVSIYFGRPMEVGRREGESKRAQQDRVREEIARRLRALEAHAKRRRP